MYSGPSTWKGRGWGMGEFYETCLHPVFPPVCALACLTVQKVKTVLFSRSINPASGFTPLLPHRPLCVFYAQKMWIFSATKLPLSTHCSEKTAPELTSPTYIPWLLQKRLTHLWFLVFTRGWLQAALRDMTSLSPQRQVRQEEWRRLNHDEDDRHHNHDNHTIIPHVLG